MSEGLSTDCGQVEKEGERDSSGSIKFKNLNCKQPNYCILHSFMHKMPFFAVHGQMCGDTDEYCKCTELRLK